MPHARCMDIDMNAAADAIEARLCDSTAHNARVVQRIDTVAAEVLHMLRERSAALQLSAQQAHARAQTQLSNMQDEFAMRCTCLRACARALASALYTQSEVFVAYDELHMCSCFAALVVEPGDDEWVQQLLWVTDHVAHASVHEAAEYRFGQTRTFEVVLLDDTGAPALRIRPKDLTFTGAGICSMTQTVSGRWVVTVQSTTRGPCVFALQNTPLQHTFDMRAAPAFVNIFDTETAFPPETILATSDDGQYVYGVMPGLKRFLRNVRSGETVHLCANEESRLDTVVFTPANTILERDYDKWCLVEKDTSFAVIRTLTTAQVSAFARHGNRVVFSTLNDAYVMDICTGAISEPLPFAAQTVCISDIAFSGNGDYVVVLQRYDLTVLDASTFSVLHSVHLAAIDMRNADGLVVTDSDEILVLGTHCGVSGTLLNGEEGYQYVFNVFNLQCQLHGRCGLGHLCSMDDWVGFLVKDSGKVCLVSTRFERVAVWK